MSNELQTQRMNSLKTTLASTYKKQIENYFGDEKKALKFLSSVVSAVQRNPALLECEPTSVINSFITMAELNLMPSDVSGEAYVIPYKGKAQFQLGYQGLVTLFYRAGVKSIISEIVYKKDDFKYKNGMVEHNPDVFADDRGEAIGAYGIVETQQGGKLAKVMSKKEILAVGQKFSKSFKTDFSPWKEANDPERWMWKKTVLKQLAKLVPKNETIFKAIASDNEDSIIADRMEKAKEESASLKMGNLLENHSEAGEVKKTPVVKKKDAGPVVDKKTGEVIDENIPVINLEDQE